FCREWRNHAPRHRLAVFQRKCSGTTGCHWALHSMPNFPAIAVTTPEKVFCATVGSADGQEGL
ncbi:hypothetical protein JS562_55725, partial [Agrobacterium sp. S2]|nr:hypothetical protein [Agrobacterium sp. S2]